MRITDYLNADTPQAARERRRLYLDMVDAIAMNDGSGDPEAFQLAHVASTVSVVLTASVFGKTTKQVARAVIRVRRKEL